jgi:hypothetical protein
MTLLKWKNYMSYTYRTNVKSEGGKTYVIHHATMKIIFMLG